MECKVQQLVNSEYHNAREAAFGNLVVRFDTFSVYVDGSFVDLGAKQFDLLRVMLDHVDQILPYAAFMTALWGNADLRRLRNLNVLVHRLRRNLEGSHPYVIRTVRGRGYGLVRDHSYGYALTRGGARMQ
jgi:two-component system OmpR family response regulator